MCFPIVFLCVPLCLFSSVRSAGSPQVVTAFTSDDDAPTPEMARSHGYSCETHQVLTEDGYILQVHRLPGGRRSPLNSSLTPVLLQHGLLDSSADWLLSGPGKALGYLLADQGYDVWLGNARGNVYSKNHTSIPSHDPRFWNWTWHEMGEYDVPAVIEHVSDVTGHQQVFYVGHSMGTTMFFALCSLRPEYCLARVRHMAALAPVAYMTHTTSPVRFLAPFALDFQKIANFFGTGQFLPRNTIMDFIFKYSCETFKFEKKICENYLFLICGHDPDQFDENLLPLILGHNPAGTSTKTLVHYAQEIRTNRFQQYDYGAKANVLVYNSSTPPVYNLSLVSVPVSLLYGDNDLLANPKDVKLLASQLKNPVGLFRVNLSSFNHLDFLWGRDAPSLVYKEVEALLQGSWTRTGSGSGKRPE